MFSRKIFGIKYFIVLVLMLLLLVGGGSIFVIGSHKEDRQVAQTATLEIFSGSVFVKTGAAGQVDAKNEQPVAVGTTIITGNTGRAQLLYPNHSATRIDFNSSFTLGKLDAAPTDIEVDLSKGRIWSRVAKLFGKETYQSKSPTVIATVRGTSYGHGILKDGRNKVFATRHSVETSCLNNTQYASVKTGTKFFLDCKEDSSSQTEPLDNSDQDGWFRFNELQDTLLEKRFGVKTYDDQDSPTPTPTIIPIPQATATPSPSATPQPTTPASMPTNTPTPTPPPARILKPTATPSPTKGYIIY